MEDKKHNKAKGVMRIYPNAPLDLCEIPHGTRLRFIRTEHDGSFVFEYEMPEVDDEKMVDAIRLALSITTAEGRIYPGCDITVDQAFAWLEEKKAKTTELPELRESEDERIRRTLVEYFGPEVQLDFVRGVPIQKIRDWLEKQKEQPTDAKSERVIKAARRVLNNWLDGINCPDVSGDFAELEYAIREYDGEEKQKEPHYTKRNALFDKCVENCDPEVMKEVSDKVDEVLGKEQKPAPISCGHENGKPAEIDMKALLTADRLASAEMTGRLKERSEILENPEKYGLCNPAEWSEEDEKMRNRLIDRLQFITFNTRTDTTSPNITFFDEIAWLKSLRPSWKPSEEQMDAFRSYIKDFQEKAEAAVGGWNNFDAMIRLYEQLKKLM